jgi:hypothetical protein
MEFVGASLADGEALELLAEAAEASALAQLLAKQWDCAGAVIDLEGYAAALEAMANAPPASGNFAHIPVS